MVALMTMKVSGLVGSPLAFGWCSFRSFAHPSSYVCNSYVLNKRIHGQARHGDHVCNLRTQDAEAGASQWIQGHPDLHSEFQGNLG